MVPLAERALHGRHYSSLHSQDRHPPLLKPTASLLRCGYDAAMPPYESWGGIATSLPQLSKQVLRIVIESVKYRGAYLPCTLRRLVVFLRVRSTNQITNPSAINTIQNVSKTKRPFTT